MKDTTQRQRCSIKSPGGAYTWCVGPSSTFLGEAQNLDVTRDILQHRNSYWLPSFEDSDCALPPYNWPDRVHMPPVRWPSFKQNHDQWAPATRASFSSLAMRFWLHSGGARCSSDLGITNALLREPFLIWEAMDMIWSLSHQRASWSFIWGWGNHGVGVGWVWWVSGTPRARWRPTLDRKQKVCHRKQEAKPQSTTEGNTCRGKGSSLAVFF